MANLVERKSLLIYDRAKSRGSGEEWKGRQRHLERFTCDRSQNAFLITEDKYRLSRLDLVKGSKGIPAELAKYPSLYEKK